MNDAADTSLLSDSRAALLVGVNATYPGVGMRTFWKKRVQLNASFPPSGHITGIFQYTAPAEADDRIVVIKDGIAHTCIISANAPQATPNTLNFTSTDLVAIPDYTGGITFAEDQRVRAIQMQGEMFFVQEGGLQPIRFNGTALYKLGVDAPSAPLDGGNIVGTGNLVTGATYRYAVTFADELGRESSPSDYLDVTMGAGGGRRINWSAPTDMQVQTIYLYRSNGTQPPGTLYRVVEGGFGNGQVTWDDNSVSDSQIVFHTAAPLPGQNDPPQPASLINIYKFRLALNSVNDVRLLQISNLQEPGSFSQLGPLYSTSGQLLNPTDGLTFDVTNEYGDEITALGHLGSVLGVWNRRTTGVLEGDNPSQYQFRIVHRVGCIAPDSVCECGDVTVFMGEDALYRLDYESGFSIRKLSDDMDAFFRSPDVVYDAPGVYPPTLSFTRQERAAAAQAQFIQNRYVLASPPYTVVFNFDTKTLTFDDMTGMPYDDGALSRGYLTFNKIHADRQYEVGLYSPGIGFSSGAIGDMYVMSYYPLRQTTPGVPEPFSFTYLTRALDGAGVHRVRLKRIKRVSVFGTIEPMTDTDGTVTAEALLSGTVTLILDGNTANTMVLGPYYFDNIQQVSTDYVGRYWARDQVQGKIFIQEFPLNATGRVAQVLITGSANGILQISDILFEYLPISS